jgi:hypothetical protein
MSLCDMSLHDDDDVTTILRPLHDDDVCCHTCHLKVDVDKPLGLTLGESKASGGGLVVKSATGNAAKAGIQVCCF